jgi:hypothetical protein
VEATGHDPGHSPSGAQDRQKQKKQVEHIEEDRRGGVLCEEIRHERNEAHRLPERHASSD